MTAEAVMKRDDDILKFTAAAAHAAGQVLQLPDGRAGFVTGLCDRAVGDEVAVRVRGIVEVAKTASIVILDGAQVYFDRSANTATSLRALAGADFKIGTAVGDAAAAATTMQVLLNAEPVYTIDGLKDPGDTVLVLTAGTPALTMGPGYAKLAFSATAEAQKVDLLSKHSIPVGIPFILEMDINIVDPGDETDSAGDFSFGLANGTHATDCDAITESMFVHVDIIDGGAVNIQLESDDTSVEVAATDTTVDFTAGTPFHVEFDCRDLEDIQVYINGVNVLPDSVFRLDSATGPLKLLAHIEKGADNTPGDVRLNHFAIRATDLTVDQN